MKNIERGQLIRRLREDRRLTQKEVADIAGVARVTVTSWEAGDLERASVLPMVHLAKALGTTVEHLILGVKPEYHWDEELVAQALTQLENLLDAGIQMEPSDKAAMFVRLYELARKATPGQAAEGVK